MATQPGEGTMLASSSSASAGARQSSALKQMTAPQPCWSSRLRPKSLQPLTRRVAPGPAPIPRADHLQSARRATPATTRTVLRRTPARSAPFAPPQAQVRQHLRPAQPLQASGALGRGPQVAETKQQAHLRAASADVGALHSPSRYLSLNHQNYTQRPSGRPRATSSPSCLSRAAACRGLVPVCR